MALKARFNGPIRYDLRSTLSVGQSVLSVSTHRMLKGPMLPSWNWATEISTRTLRVHLATAFRMKNIVEARRYLNAVSLDNSDVLSKVQITPVAHKAFRGHWFVPRMNSPSTVLFYAHGGGYSFYPSTYANLIASIALAADCRTFALDYSLAPEHRFPYQLEEARAAYSWLLKTGVLTDKLIVGGDSAGGNLTMALLLSLRNSNTPLPTLAVLLSPATDFVAPAELPPDCSFVVNAPYDWIQQSMLMSWVDWFCDPSQRNNPLVSPVCADLRGLPPLYIQAGYAEILYDSINAFVQRARREGADVQFDVWKCMNHDFQLFGSLAPQSIEAVRRIGEVIKQHTQNSSHAADRDCEARRRT